MTNPESVYYYIAQVNPNGAEEVLYHYGFARQAADVTTDELANAMYSIVQTDGEPALRDIMSIHPDKAMILELFETPDNGTTTTSTTTAPTPTVCTVPPLPIGQNAKMYSCNGMHDKSFFSSPTNCLLVGVAAIAVLAMLKS